MNPKIFKMEKAGLGDSGGNSNPKGDMIGRHASEGREGSIGKVIIPTKVYESSVQPF